MAAKQHTFSREQIEHLLDYDRETGIFRWRVALNGRIRVGQQAGTLNHPLGYVNIRIGRVYVQAHRLAWFLHYDVWPDHTLDIDHINGDRKDNRIQNLRLLNRSHNVQNRYGPNKNNKSGKLGVYYKQKVRGKPWYSVIRVDDKQIFLGYFATAEEAEQAHLEARRKFYAGNCL